MSVNIKLKHSSQSGKVPNAGNLSAGEIALNTADVKAYMLNDAGEVVTLVGGDSPIDDRYVNVNGDNMTGDLTLGTDKITLDATSGQSKFSDNLQVSYGGPGVNVNGAEDNGVFVGAGGVLTITGNTSRSIMARGFEKGGTSQKWGIYSNGDIISAGYISSTSYLYMGPNGSNSPTITLDASDGSASFAGDVTMGTSTTEAKFLVAGRTSPRLALKGNATTSSVAYYQDQATNDLKWNLNGDGSASFAGGAAIVSAQGKVEVKRNDVGEAANNNAAIVVKNGVTNANAVQLYGTGAGTFSGAVTVDTPAGTTGDVFLVKAGGTANAFITATGDATFAGNVTAPNITFNLDIDNEDNYTTTTEEYTETETYTIEVPVIETGVGTADLVDGDERETRTVTRERELTKTREVKTYTGPTMDVKEQLLAYEARFKQQDAVIAQMTSLLKGLGADVSTLPALEGVTKKSTKKK